MIHRGPTIQLRGARGGVAIILLNTLTEEWKKGGHIIKRGGEMVGRTTRQIRDNIKIRDTTKNKN